jgi:uncharacterized protein
MEVNITTINSDMLSGLLGSKLRAKVLGWLFIHSDNRYFVRQLSNLLQEDSTNLSRELTRLEKMGLLVLTPSGKQKYYQANSQNPAFSELRKLIERMVEIRNRQCQSGDKLIDGRFNLSSTQLESFCRRNNIKKLSLFGSVLRDDFRPESDIDILVEFEAGHVPGFAIIGMEKEFSGLLKRKVDMRTPADLSRYFRDEVVRDARVKYEHTR